MSGFIRPFLPWIAYAGVTSLTDWRYGALVAFLMTAWELIAAHRAGRDADAMVIEASSGLYFALVTALAFADPGSPLRPYIQAASSARPALTAWGSPAVRRPFTLGIAKPAIAAAAWHNPRFYPAFYRVNAVITATWAAGFTLSGGAPAALAAVHRSGTPVTLVSVAGFVHPAVLTVRCTGMARARAAATA